MNNGGSTYSNFENAESATNEVGKKLKAFGEVYIVNITSPLSVLGQFSVEVGQYLSFIYLFRNH